MKIDAEKLINSIISACKEASSKKPTGEELGDVTDVLATIYAAHLSGLYEMGLITLDQVRELADGTKSLALDMCNDEDARQEGEKIALGFCSKEKGNA